MGLVTAYDTAERLLRRAIGPIGVVARVALLRTVGGLHPGGFLPAFGSHPREVFGDVGQVRRVQVRVHSPGLKLHASHIQVLESDFEARVVIKELIHGPVDLLPDVSGQTLARAASGRR